MKTIFFLLCLTLTLCGCHKDNDNAPTGPGDTTATFDPFERDDIDKSMDEPDMTAAAAKCQTYKSSGFRNGRQAWKINKPLWKYFRYASVRFSSGFSVSRVVMAKANRFQSGKGRGFVIRPGSQTPNIVFIQAPYGDKSQLVTICPR